jgi:DNA topoisomerase-1
MFSGEMAVTSLVVVESPAKAKTINKILGPNYVVRATVGHIMDLATPKGGLGVDVENGFKPKYQVLPDKADKIKAILDAARTVDTIFIASDKDREGEAIAFHVASQLKKLKKPIKRAEFNQITAAAVKKGIANPRKLDQDLYDAQQARRVLDRIVGFMVSPYLGKKLGNKASAGRVQSVALRMIVERERDIQAFVPEEYWNITATLAKPSAKTKKFLAKYIKKVTDKKAAEKIKKDLEGALYAVTNIKQEDKEKPAPPPLTTSKLQQDAAARFKMTADRTMKAAQALYEAGYVTYIRTDSVHTDPAALDTLREWLGAHGFAGERSPKPILYKAKDAAQAGHEAIRPTDVDRLPADTGLTGDQLHIYNLIWVRFICSQMKPAIFATTTVDISTNVGHNLRAEGKEQKYHGWLIVGKEFDKGVSKKDVILPSLQVDDELILVPPKVKAEQKKTQPPSRYNDGTLVKELEKKEIGRPSTYAAIIGKISTRKYVKKVKAGFVPTDLGCRVVDDLKEDFSFMDYKYTARMEKLLDKMAQGKLGYVEMLEEFFKGFQEEYRKATNSQGMEAGIPCPECGEKTYVRHGKYVYFAGCVKYPECKGLVGVRIEDGEVIPNPRHEVVEGVTCPKCGHGMVKRDGKFGPFYSCEKYPRCTGKRKVPFGKKCPCGGELYLTVFNDELKLACMEYPQCRNVEEIPKGAKVDWVPPEQVSPAKLDRKVEKVLKSK